MKRPIYIITGFLDSGKTGLLNEILPKRAGRSPLVLQFESGEEELVCQEPPIPCLRFRKKELEEAPSDLTKRIAEAFNKYRPKEVWIEYNGMALFSQLYTILSSLACFDGGYRIERVIYTADYPLFMRTFGKTGAAPLEQLANADIVLAGNMQNEEEEKRLRRIAQSFDPSIRVFRREEKDALFRELFRQKPSLPSRLFLSSIGLALLFLLFSQLLEDTSEKLNTVINVFLGITLQAFPFLLIGVLLSSLIQVFVSKETIERIFPKHLGAGILTAIFAGFFLPVCDCASIPIFRSLLRKGVPLSAAVAFMTATPVINPVVMLSTYYAFNGNLRIVFGRILLGILSAAAIGLLFHFLPAQPTERFSQFTDLGLCICGCYDAGEESEGLRGKLFVFLRHSQIEFFNVGKYLLIGAMVTAILQTSLSRSFAATSPGGLAASILLLMVTAFLLSLCSSSDAMIARALAGRFPMPAIMGFLVFGPMMDIKNVLLLSGYFSKKFILRLITVCAAVCFVTVFLFSKFLTGV
ncbi:MAG: permease [Peptostreptococcaceae bacterium]|nr:permease [Peptostreptococcaceae bacterium]